ncbi:MAG: hypothetical protein JNJ89_00440 [Rubrivivax sp.]|nr:hypothetical protein [Rubrivivax sp.]
MPSFPLRTAACAVFTGAALHLSLAHAAGQDSAPASRLILARPAVAAPGASTQAPIARPELLPENVRVQIQFDQLTKRIDSLQQEVRGLRAQLDQQRRQFDAHSHQYQTQGNFNAISLDAIAPKGTLYHGRGMVLLGGVGVPGSGGALTRTSGTTSKPVQAP